MATELKKSSTRWFSTGFMGGGVGGVDAEKHTLKDAVVVRPGEALGHGLWIDQEFCADIASRGAAFADKGVKARFGHPNMCSEALGTFLGRWKGLKMGTDGKVTGDLFLSSTASESPKGDLRKYVEEMAAKEPEHFGASIVFTRNEDCENEFMLANGFGTEAGFKSPDPKNTGNLPHARCAELHAADLVDDPAATDGMFSGIGGASLAAQMTEWLDLHPQVLKALNSDPGLVDIVERYADQLKPFLARYAANQPITSKTITTTITLGDVSLTETKAAESAKPAEAPQPAEPDATVLAENASLKSLLDEAKANGERLGSELAAERTKKDAAEKETARLGAELESAKTKLADVSAKLTEAENKLAAIQKGAPPASNVPAPVGPAVRPFRQAQIKRT